MSEENSSLADVTQPIATSAAVAAVAPVSTGRVLAGRYRLGRSLATGATSGVFEATQIDLIRRVAIKVLAPAHATEPVRVRDFERQARLAARLQHPHIAAVHDFGRLPDGAPFMVMELVAGPTLREHLALEVALPWREVLRFGKQLAAALACAHDAEVLHGDISTSNVLLHATGVAYSCKLIDFGVAVEVGDRGKPRASFATPAYAAPERFAGAPPNVPSDIFALGALMTQMLGVPAPAGVPSGLRELLAAMLEPTPARRPKSAHEVLRRLHAIATGTPYRLPALHVVAAASLASAALALLVIAAFGERPAEATAAAIQAPATAPVVAAMPLLAVSGVHARATPAMLNLTGDRALERAEILAAVDRALSRRNERAARDRYPVMARRDGAARIAFDASGNTASVTYRKHVASAVPGATRTSAVSQRELWSRVDGRWQLVRR